MFLIVGLGNPGDKYSMSRHNVGFLVLDSLLGHVDWEKDSQANAFTYQDEIQDHIVEYIKPQTFMNNSGSAVQYALRKHEHELAPENIIVIYDDIDLPIGTIRISQGCGDGGHNGIKSIQNHIKSKNFIRVRVGIAPTDSDGNVRKPTGGLFTSKQKAVANYVLKNLSRSDRDKIRARVADIREALEVIITQGVEQAMNRFN